jgi:hypothetical protein
VDPELRGQTEAHWPDGSHETTDQKVGGSSPSERAPSTQVRALLRSKERLRLLSRAVSLLRIRLLPTQVLTLPAVAAPRLAEASGRDQLGGGGPGGVGGRLHGPRVGATAAGSAAKLAVTGGPPWIGDVTAGGEIRN